MTDDTTGSGSGPAQAGTSSAGTSSAGTSAAGTSAAGTGQDLGAQITVVGGNPTATEVAAVTAVLAATLEELRGRDAAATAGPVVSAWQRSQRPLRGTLTPGVGQWRGFSG